MGGGKSGGSQSEIQDYFSSQGAVFAVGGKISLVELLTDDKSVWKPGTPIDLTGVSNPYQFDIAGRGRRYVYPGSAAQTLTDPVLTKGSRDHPAMRGKLVLVEENSLAGRERTSVPENKLVIRREGEQSVITGAAALLDADGQCNPLVALVEAQTSGVDGVGLDPSNLDATTWQALADAYLADSANTYLSIKIDALTTWKELASRMRGYVDFWLRVNSAGKIEIGAWASGEEAPSGLEVVTEHDLDPDSVPQIKPTIESELPNKFTVAWTNPDLAYDTDVSRYQVESDYAEREMEFKRPWVFRGDQSQTLVSRLGKREATSKDDLTLQVRESKAKLIKQGDLFIHSYTQTGYLQICRCIKRIGFGSSSSYVRIVAETDRGLSPSAAAFAFESANYEAESVLADLDYWHVLQAPNKLDDEPYSLIALAGRVDGLMSGFSAYFKSASTDYQFLGQQRSWAVPVQIAAAYDAAQPLDDDSGNLKIKQYATNAPFGFDLLQSAMTEDEYADDLLLLVVVKATDPTVYEFLSIKLIDSPVASEYPLRVLRARQGTDPQSLSLDDPAYIVKRSDLVLYNHQSLAGMADEPLEADRIASLKLRPFNFRDILDLADASAKSLEIVERIISDPTGVDVDGLLSGFAISFTAPDEVVSGKLWFSTTPTRPAEHAKSFEAKQGPNRVEYLSSLFANSPTRGFFWIQLFDDKGNRSNILGYYSANSGSGVDDGQRVSINADNQVATYNFLFGAYPAQFILTAHAEGYSGPIAYQWYYLDSGSSRVDLVDETESELTVTTATMGLERTYGVEVNGSQYDEMTLIVLRSKVVEKAMYLSNENATVLVDEAGTPMQGELGSQGITFCRVRVFNGAAPLSAVASAPSSIQYALTVPAGLLKSGNDAFYLDDAAALTGTETDFTITIDIGGVLYYRNYRIIERAIARLAATLEIVPDGELYRVSPVAADTLTLSGLVRRGPADTVAQRDVLFAIAATTGVITLVSTGGYTDDLTQIGLEGGTKDYRLAIDVTNDGSGNVATLNGKTRPLTKLQKISDAYNLRWYSSFDEIFLGDPDFGAVNVDARGVWFDLVSTRVENIVAAADARSEGAAYFDATSVFVMEPSSWDDWLAPVNTDFHVSFFAKVTGAAGVHTIFSNRTDVGTIGNFDKFSVSLDTALNKIVLIHEDTTNALIQTDASYTFDANYHHYLVFFNYSAFEVLFYVDGVLVHTESLAAATWLQMPYDGQLVTFGSKLIEERAGYQTYDPGMLADQLEGDLDEFAIIEGIPSVDDIAFLGLDKRNVYQSLVASPVHHPTYNAIYDSPWAANLRLHLAFDGNANDSVAGGVNMSLVGAAGAVSYIEGVTSQGANFDGATSLTYAYQGGHYAIDPANCTICFWLKLSSVLVGGRTQIMKFRSGAGVTSQVQCVPSNGHVEVFLENPAIPTEKLVAYVQRDPDDKWHHYAFVLSTNPALQNKGYVDGRAAGSGFVSFSSRPSPVIGDFDDHLSIGGVQQTFDKFKGGLDEVMIFDRFFSHSEIQSLADRNSGWTIDDNGTPKYIETDHLETYANGASKTIKVTPRASDGAEQTVTLRDVADGSGIEIDVNLEDPNLAIVSMSHAATGTSDSANIVTEP